MEGPERATTSLRANTPNNTCAVLTRLDWLMGAVSGLNHPQGGETALRIPVQQEGLWRHA
jgi:hypothetical protein